MSYVRFNQDGSEVYLYGSDSGIVCCGCKLEEDGWATLSPKDMLEHLRQHVKAKHVVPGWLFELIKEEVKSDEREVILPELKKILKRLQKKHIEISVRKTASEADSLLGSGELSGLKFAIDLVNERIWDWESE